MNLNDLIYLIPGNNTQEYDLENGVLLGFPKAEGRKQHIDILEYIQNTYHFPNPDSKSVDSYAKLFCSMGIVLIVSLGSIDGLYGANLFLPEQMTLEQIKKLESLKDDFKKHFYTPVALFKPMVYSINHSLTYKLRNNCLRDLKIESYIDGSNIEDGQELLYREIETQKENIPRKNK